MAEPAAGRSPARAGWKAAIAALLIALAALAGWLWRQSSRARWVQAKAIPEITRLVAAEDFQKAGALLKEARAVAPNDPTLEKLWLQSTIEVSVESTPPGADVSYRPYRGAPPPAWTPLGRTPLAKQRIPKNFYLWRIEKAGFNPAYEIEPTWTLVHRIPYTVTCRLDPAGSVPAEMVRVPGKNFQPFIPGLVLPEARIDDFLIDRTEVTNEEFKKFVDAGGYQKREYWKEPFVRDGKPVSFEDAMAAFRDATGRPGPATWEAGSFPKGFEKHPVAGVSWYESAAYAAFAGKTLPTVYHWNRAAQTEASLSISPVSNFQGTGTLAVGGDRISGFGTTDMAGNVKEWCANKTSAGRRFILGGGFGEPTYMFIDQDAQSPWDRRPNYGFRCVRLPAAPSVQAAARVEPVFRDFSKEAPASDELFRAYKSSYAYDKTNLNARVEESVAADDWREERVSIDAAYGGGAERFIIHLFLPKNTSPPYQTVVYFPGSGAIQQDKFNLSPYADFVPRSGRALVAPVFKSTFERRDAFRDDNPAPTAFYRDHLIAWSKDLGRTLDYLETRNDIRRDALAYLGLSWGSQVAPVMLAVENRFKTAILESGGLDFSRALPEA
ncbi:MAG TPA: SUMF1/EgtB/PvdO family nonheme iron enzyme, partial [Thermoanaerobaculia bacterium]